MPKIKLVAADLAGVMVDDGFPGTVMKYGEQYGEGV